ncbi:MAG: alpha/beta hydrolase family protein [Acidobacteriota bacterium]
MSTPEKKFARRRFLQASSVAAFATAHFASSTTPAKALVSLARPQTIYQSPLKDFSIDAAQFDSLLFTQAMYAEQKPAMTFEAKDERAARLWQKRVRRKIAELVGGFPPSRVALQAKILETKDFKDYTREKIIFQSREQLAVFGYLLLPKNRPQPLPVVICLPGHGRGCDDIVGIDEQGNQRQTKPGYAYDFALQVVENGYAAFAIEQLAFGCRRDEAARKKGAGQSSCQPAAGAALLFGQTMIGWRVWDVMRAIDYLQTRKEIDRQRIATMGISGGGTISLFAAALDERIKVSVVSGYFNTFRDSILSLSHCIDNYVPGILNVIEMYDLAGLVAPRALFVESGLKDPIFPIAGSHRAFKQAQMIYQTFGVADQLGREVFDDGHVFYGKGAFQFLKTNL